MTRSRALCARHSQRYSMSSLGTAWGNRTRDQCADRSGSDLGTTRDDRFMWNWRNYSIDAPKMSTRGWFSGLVLSDENRVLSSTFIRSRKRSAAVLSEGQAPISLKLELERHHCQPCWFSMKNKRHPYCGLHGQIMLKVRSKCDRENLEPVVGTWSHCLYLHFGRCLYLQTLATTVTRSRADRKTHIFRFSSTSNLLNSKQKHRNMR